MTTKKQHGPLAALAAWCNLYVAEVQTGVSLLEAIARDEVEQELKYFIPLDSERARFREMTVEVAKAGVGAEGFREMLRHYTWSLNTWFEGPLHQAEGVCPSCGKSLLRFDVRFGTLFCSAPGCENRFAAGSVLSETETEHVVEVDAERFHVKHPLRERIGNALLTCTVHQQLSELRMPEPGRYRVSVGEGDVLAFEVLS